MLRVNLSEQLPLPVCRSSYTLPFVSSSLMFARTKCLAVSFVITNTGHQVAMLLEFFYEKFNRFPVGFLFWEVSHLI